MKHQIKRNDKNPILIYQHCQKCNGKNCDNCSNYSPQAGRTAVIEEMKKSHGYVDSGMLRNIVEASPLVLFKDLGRVLNVSPTLTNEITTTELTKNFLMSPVENGEPIDVQGLIIAAQTFMTPDKIEKLKPVFDNIDYVNECVGTIYGASIHASGTLLSKSKLPMPIDNQDGSCHFNGYYADDVYKYCKYDLLSLNTLDPIVKILGFDIDWNDTSDDIELMEFLHSLAKNNNTDFIFQFGSPVVNNMIGGIEEDKVDLISIAETSAINRPGCLKINMNTTWVDQKNGTLPYQNEVSNLIEQMQSNNILKI